NNVFNVGFNGENYRKIQIAEFVKGFISDVHVDIIKKGADLRDYQVDFSKLKKFLNIEKTFTPQDGIGEVLNLLREGIIQNPSQSYYYNLTPDLLESQLLDRVSDNVV
ncbi:MAG: hypothetical protein ABII25_09425, partial [bacterium]